MSTTQAKTQTATPAPTTQQSSAELDALKRILDQNASGAGSRSGDDIVPAPTLPQSAPAKPIARPSDKQSPAARIMIVDDEPVNIKVVRKYLQGAGYEDFVTTTESTKAFQLIRDTNPDVVLLDVMMPHIDGLAILESLRAVPALRCLPVIILTAATDNETRHKALGLGATDFLHKPVEPLELIPRVRNALIVKSHQDHLKSYSLELEHAVRQRTAELEASRRDVIFCLARAAEFRDDDTGHHILRVGRYAGIIADELGFDTDYVKLIEPAAQLHDVGKIGIPDAILLKPGQLNPDEFDTVKKHCGFGKKIIQPLPVSEYERLKGHTTIGSRIMEVTSSPVLQMASRIAVTHHEKWDGSGYPLGLAGEDIPVEGRIVAVADVFDALSSARPYKPPFPREKCLAIMQDLRGTHFDPRILDAFIARINDIIQVQIEYADLQ